MNWDQISWPWIVEPIVLVLLIGMLVKILVSNFKKIDHLSDQMCTSATKAQTYLKNVDHEFEIINTCAKSIKSVFLNFGKVYKDISEGRKTIDDVVRDAENSIPDELRNNLSKFLTFPMGESFSSMGTETQEPPTPTATRGPSLEFQVIKSKSKKLPLDEYFDFRTFRQKNHQVNDGGISNTTSSPEIQSQLLNKSKR